MSVLIVTLPGDVHAHATRWAIERLGGRATIIYPADLCDGARWALDQSTSRLTMDYSSQRIEVDLNDYGTVWTRRPPALLPQMQVVDELERANTEGEFGYFASSIYAFMERGRLAVNSAERTRAASLKPLQIAVANEVGLNTPRTLIANAPDAIHDFWETCNHEIVFKPFKGSLWHNRSGLTLVRVTRVTREILEECDLASAPGIFQECVDKCCEVRVTIMGRSVFAWEKRFDDARSLHVDWSFISKGAIFSKHHLPTDIEQACFDLMDRLALVFGCLDLVIDRAGRYYFIEINPQGQWLWGDSRVEGLNQLEAMAAFLISGDAEFRHSQRNSFTYSEYKRDVRSLSNTFGDAWHFGDFADFAHYQLSFKL